MESKAYPAFDEYKLCVETQMHFNDMLMKLRTLGLTAVIIILGYAVTRAETGGQIILNVGSFRMTEPQAMALGSLALLLVIFLLDFCYFYRLLLGAVDRGNDLEQKHGFCLTGAICKRVPPSCANFVLIVAYVVVLAAVLITFWTLPRPGKSITSTPRTTDAIIQARD